MVLVGESSIEIGGKFPNKSKFKKINDCIFYNPIPETIIKTSDTYLEVKFIWGEIQWDGVIPLDYRFYGKNIDSANEEEICSWIKECYDSLNPLNYTKWESGINTYWKEQNATKNVFDILNHSGNLSRWICRTHQTSKINDQSASRIRAIKQSGYVIITKRMYCEECGKQTNWDMLVRLPRKSSNVLSRVTMSEKLKKKIYKTLEHREVFWDRVLPTKELVIDHKFPSSRWKEGDTENSSEMSEQEIKNKFQLLTNQSNLLKEKACQSCVKENKRGVFLGIEWYYEGDINWQGTDKYDENGCVGCPWYDIAKWKREVKRAAESNK